MNKEQIKLAFDGRWRVYGLDDSIEDNAKVKEVAYKFFEAGVLLASQETKSDDTSVLMEDFETWWNIYQKKRGKEKCMAKWNKLSLVEKQSCIAATPAYVASTPDKQYRKDPLTYLNGKCWEDEIIMSNGNKPNDPAEKLADILVG